MQFNKKFTIALCIAITLCQQILPALPPALTQTWSTHIGSRITAFMHKHWKPLAGITALGLGTSWYFYKNRFQKPQISHQFNVNNSTNNLGGKLLYQGALGIINEKVFQVQQKPTSLVKIQETIPYQEDVIDTSIIKDDSETFIQYFERKERTNKLQPLDMKSYFELAIEHNALEIIKYLIKKYRTNEYSWLGSPPISMAIKMGEGSLKAFQCLVEEFLGDDKNLKRIIDYIFKVDNCKAFDYLVSKHCIDFQKYTYGTTKRNLLHFAIENNASRIVTYIIERQLISINEQDNQGNTPLHLAIPYSDKELIDYLITHCAKQTIENSDKKIPLEMIIWSYKPLINLDKVIYLIKDLDFKPNEKGSNERTLLHYVAQNNEKDAADVIQYLLQEGAEKDIKDNDGKRPYDYATDQKIKDLLK